MDAIEKRIRDAITKVKADGVVISDGEWNVSYTGEKWKVDEGDDYPWCCALGAVLLADNPPSVGGYQNSCTLSAAVALGVTKHWVDSFTSGFDGAPLPENQGDGDAWDLGHRLRGDFADEVW